MKCPDCGSQKTRVTNTYRTAQSVRRRHACRSCRFIFYTFQQYETDLTVKKVAELMGGQRKRRSRSAL